MGTLLLVSSRIHPIMLSPFFPTTIIIISFNFLFLLILLLFSLLLTTTTTSTTSAQAILPQPNSNNEYVVDLSHVVKSRSYKFPDDFYADSGFLITPTDFPLAEKTFVLTNGNFRGLEFPSLIQDFTTIKIQKNKPTKFACSP